MWLAPRDTRGLQVWWVLKDWPESRGSLDFQAYLESENQVFQVLLVNRAVQRVTRDLQEKMDYQEIPGREDRQGPKEPRVTPVKCAQCFLRTAATRSHCEGRLGLKEIPDYRG